MITSLKKLIEKTGPTTKMDQEMNFVMPKENWIKLNNLPVWTSDRSLLKLSDTRFICVKYSERVSKSTQEKDCDHHMHQLDLYQYNSISDNWTEVSFNIKKHWKYYLKVTVDETNQCFYIYTTDGKLYTINPESQSNVLELISSGLPQYRYPWQMLCVDGKIIVMAEELRGFVVDTKDNMKFTEISRSGNFQLTNYSPPLISKYISSKKQIINIVEDVDRGDSYIHKYSLDDNKLFETGYKFSRDTDIIRTSLGCVLTKCQRYLIILGGFTYKTIQRKTEFYDIVLFDIEKQMVSRSKLKCPFKGAMQAISMSSDKRDELLVSGYVRQLWQSPRLQSLKIFPELLHLIFQKISIEYIHIVSSGIFRDHWKINVDDILNSITVD